MRDLYSKNRFKHLAHFGELRIGITFHGCVKLCKFQSVMILSKAASEGRQVGQILYKPFEYFALLFLIM